MIGKVLILDTSVMCCWLRVPGKEEAGPVDDRWDYDRIEKLLTEEREQGSTFVLPIATVIETGNHIAQAPSHRYERATALTSHLLEATDAATPWAAFTQQSSLWDPENLRALAADWPSLAARGITIGDATIKGVAEFYAGIGYNVEILTGDKGLKAYEPAKPALVPRRRK